MAPRDLLSSRAVVGAIMNRLEQGEGGWVRRLGMYMPSDQATEHYAWLGATPAMREWVGGRLAKDLRENTWDVRNKPHEATLRVKKDELRRDKFGQLQIRINELADRAIAYPAKLMSALMLAGESTTGYDGQYFFDTDHAEGESGTQSNDITFAAATGTTPTVPEMRDAIMSGIQQIVGFKDDQGEPMNENAAEFEVHVPIGFLATALSAVTLPVIDGGAVNIANAQKQFKITVVANVRLTWTDKIAIFRTDSDTKAFIVQEETPLEVDAIAEGSELEFTHREHLYGVYWSGAVALGMWQRACLVTFT
jgi:phage major head subunit gpT-like protein